MRVKKIITTICAVALITTIMTVQVFAESYSTLCSSKKTMYAYSGTVNFELNSYFSYVSGTNTSTSVKLHSLGVLVKNLSSYTQVTNANFYASNGASTHTNSKYDVLAYPVSYGETKYHERDWSTVTSNRTYEKDGSYSLAYFYCEAKVNLGDGTGHTAWCYSSGSVTFS